MAELYLKQDRYADAEPLFKRSVAVFEKAYGPNHLEVAVSLYNLAGLYKEQGRDAEAAPLIERAKAIRQRAR